MMRAAKPRAGCARAAWTTLTVALPALAAALAAVLLALPRGPGWEAGALVAIRRFADTSAPWAVALRGIMSTATLLGSFPALAAVVASAFLLLSWLGRAREGARLVAAAALGIAAANGLKLVVGRPRPEIVPHWAAVSSTSFPSGHSADGALVYLLLAGVAARGMRGGPAAGLLVGTAAFVAIIGLSRLYLGVHWPSDVLAGWCFGAAWAGATLHPVAGPRRPHLGGGWE